MTARIGLFILAAAAVASLTTASAWAQTNVLYLNSQPGDYIGQGRRVTYTTGSFTELGFSTQIVGFSFYADTDATYWYLDFAAPQGQALGPGMYEGATRYPFQSPTHVGLDVSGDGRACNTLTGRFLVLDASYDVDGSVLTFAADFEQHCEGGTSALYGAIRVNSSLPIVPKLAIGDAAVIENPVGTPMKFTISLSQPAAGPVMVQFATADGTAQAGSDYVATSGTVTFKPAETSRPIAIQTLSDRAAEGDQYFYVNLSGPVGATVADSQGQGTIVDTGGPQSFLILDSQPGDYVGQGVKQKLTTLDGNFKASVANDKAAGVTFEGDTSWALSFAAPGNAVLTPGEYDGATRYPFQQSTHPGLDVSGDGRGCNTLVGRFVVVDATYDVSGNPLSFAAEFEQHCEGQAPALYGAIWFQSTAAPVPLSSGAGQYQFSAPSYTVKEGVGVAKVTVRRLNGNGSTGTVDYATEDGTATSVAGPGQDYTPKSGTLTFVGSQTTAIFQVPVTKDAVDEPTETVLLSLSNPQPMLEGASLGAQDTAVLTIADDDLGGKIQFSAAAYSVNAATGAASAKLTVKRIGGAAGGVTVHYATSDGTATAGADYTSASGDLTFASSGTGAVAQPLAILVAQNSAGAKTFVVTLSSPAGGAALGTPASATVTILGAQPTLGFSTAAYTVKTTRPTALITVKRAAPLTGTVTVHYASSPGTATNNGVDYTDVAEDLTFAPNASTKTFLVPITRDTFVDVPKTVDLTLSSPAWSLGTAVLDPARAASTLTIVDPNITPSVQFSAARYVVNEAAPKALITVKRTGDLAGTLTVEYAATGGTAVNGDPNVDPNADYTLSSGTLTFLPNKTSMTFPVSIVNDAQSEGTETAVLSLGPPSWTGGTAVLGAIGATTLSITDNEPTVQFSVAAYSVSEAARSVLISVKRTGGVTGTATVVYAVTGGSAVPDTGAGGDYVPFGPATLTFLPGQALKTFPITLEPDTFVEGPRTIELTLSSPTGALLGTPSTAMVTLKDDDKAGQVQFGAAAYSVSEAAGTATITVTRTGGAASLATIHYSTLDADPGTTAVGGADYTATSGTLTFGAGEKAKTFGVSLFDNGTPDFGVASIILALDTPGGGLTSGSPSVTTLWIVRE
jgi:hypothetical protein